MTIEPDRTLCKLPAPNLVEKGVEDGLDAGRRHTAEQPECVCHVGACPLHRVEQIPHQLHVGLAFVHCSQAQLWQGAMVRRVVSLRPLQRARTHPVHTLGRRRVR